MLPILRRSQLKSVIFASVSILIAMMLVLYPEQAFKSSLRGLIIWWDVVFPALLPFFITAEMMMGFGVVHFLGVLLEPLMRPIFRVPGAGAFVMVVGLISGNPMGAKLTAHLREQKLISREEGERLICFTSTAGPLFIFGAVAVGFFENESIGIILAIAHYSSSIIIGFLMRYYQSDAPPSPSVAIKSSFILWRALREMHQARLTDSRPLGRLVGEAVTSAIQTLLLIGGFIIVFSVLVNLIDHIGFMLVLAKMAANLFQSLSIPTILAHPWIAGLFEMTLGSQMTSATSNSVPLLYKLIIVSMIIGWNGLSIHAQVVSMLSKTDIRYFPYFFAKILHGFIAAIITLLLYHPLQPYFHDVPTFANDAILSSSLTWTMWELLKWFSIIVAVGWLSYHISCLFKPKATNVKID
jgi:sporulation integral membrane protein YlbJ